MSYRSDQDLETLVRSRLRGDAADPRRIAAARERVWSQLQRRVRRHPSPLGRIATAALALAAVVVVALALGWAQHYRLEVAAGPLPVLYREEVGRADLRNDLVNAEMALQLRHLEGAAGLRAGALIDVRISSDGLPATVEIRARTRGTIVAEVIGRTAQLQEVRRATDVTRTSFFAPLPPTERGETNTYEVWLFLETSRGVFESDKLVVEVAGRPEGERARILPR